MTKVISHQRAIVYAVLSFTIWTVGDCFTKIIGQAGLHPSQIIIGSSLFCGLTILGVAAVRGRLSALVTKSLKLELARSLLYTIQSFVNVIAFTLLPLTTVYIALFTSPMLVTLFAALFLRERLPLKQIAVIVAGFGGVLLAFLPEQGGQNLGGAMGIAALALFPVLASVQAVLIRFLGRTETSESMALFPIVARVPLVLPFCIVNYQPMTLDNWLVFAVMGVCGGTGVLLMTAALKKAPAGLVHSFMYSQLVSGAILGYLVWHDVPSVQRVVGAVVIVAAGLYMIHASRRERTVQTFAGPVT